ncbi:MAG: DUF5908 family protein [Acidobacteriota bacterium]
MPIEIRELVIRARIDPGEGRGDGPQPSPAAAAGPSREVVQECVAEVLRILEQKGER